jgi:hypothetical protein
LPVGPAADKLHATREPGRLREVRAMSSETRRYIEEVSALSPWIAFVIAVAWFWVLEVRTMFAPRAFPSESVCDNPRSDPAAGRPRLRDRR